MNLGRDDHSESIVEKIELVTCTSFLSDNCLFDVSTRHSLLFFNRYVNKKVMRNFIYIQHIVKITVVLGLLSTDYVLPEYFSPHHDTNGDKTDKS